MITVENILNALCNLVIDGSIKGDWHKNFIQSVATHVAMGKPLSTNQSENVLKIARNSITNLSKTMRKPQAEVEAAIATPRHNQAPYQSASIKREVRYAGNDMLAFRFKHDPTAVADFKALKSATDPLSAIPYWNAQHRLWIVTVTPSNLDKVFNLIKRHRFEFDDAVLEYLTLCSNSKNVESVVVFDPESEQLVANVAGNPLLAYVMKNVLKGELV